jgi:hypothetical protein
MGSEPKTRRELAAESTREDLLEAGSQLAYEAFKEGLANPLRLLSPTDIAERASSKAPVTRGMLYHLWPIEDRPGAAAPDRLDGYLAALFRRLFEEQFDSDTFVQSASAHLPKPEDGAEPVALAALVCAMANLQYARYRFGAAGESATRYRFATLLAITGDGLRRTGKISDEDVLELRSRRPYAQLTDLYEWILETYGLELIAPFEVEDLTQMLWAMQDGFTLNSWHFERLNNAVDPEGGLLGEDWAATQDAWSPFAVAAFCLIRGITQPRTSATPSPITS